LCLQKYLFLDPSRLEGIEKCEAKYQNVLSSYASDCVYKVVSLIRSIIIWNIPESHTNRLGPWSEDYMPFTRFILRNNLRLMFCLLAVTTTSPFRIDRIPCFSRYIGIRSLVIWEMRSRVLSLYEWIKVLRNGSVHRLLEVCLPVVDRMTISSLLSPCDRLGAAIIGSWLFKKDTTVNSMKERARRHFRISQLDSGKPCVTAS
jgi:hypothetical protein